MLKSIHLLLTLKFQDLDFSYNFFRKIRNPSPHSFEESHGTYCAGIIGMKEDNGVCGVGMAPHATIGGDYKYQ